MHQLPLGGSGRLISEGLRPACSTKPEHGSKWSVTQGNPDSIKQKTGESISILFTTKNYTNTLWTDV